jgi:outer membrane protein TolC
MIGLRPARLVLSLLAFGLGVGAQVFAEDAPLPAGPLGADDAVRIALERNNNVAIAHSDYQAARGVSWQALRGVLPSVVSGAQFIHTDVTGPAIVDNRPSVGRTEADSRTVNVQLDQNVFSWSDIHNLKGARAGARSSYELAQAEELDVALAVRTQFYELLRALKQREVRDEGVKLNEDQLTRAETLFELGSVARSDVLQARVNLQGARLQQIRARNLAEIARGQLAQLMGLPADTPLEIRDEISATMEVEAVEAVEMDSTAIVAEALRERPDMEAARENVRSSEAFLSAARGGRYPELFGRVNWFWTGRPGSDFDPFSGQELENDTDGWIASAGVALPIFDGMLTEGQVKTAKSQLASERSRQSELELLVGLEVQEGILDVRDARQFIAASREGVSLAEENLKLAQERYDVGSGTLLELDEAQVSLINARSALVDSQAALRVAQARLTRARGAGLP